MGLGSASVGGLSAVSDVRVLPRYPDISLIRCLVVVIYAQYHDVRARWQLSQDNTRLRSAKGWAPIHSRPRGPSILIKQTNNQTSEKMKPGHKLTTSWDKDIPAQCVKQIYPKYSGKKPNKHKFCARRGYCPSKIRICCQSETSLASCELESSWQPVGSRDDQLTNAQPSPCFYY